MLDQFILKGAYLKKMTDDEFFHFCQSNEHLRIERNEKLEIIIMAPVGAETSGEELEISRQLGNWVIESGLGGKAFSPTAGFFLNNKSMYSPDAAWIASERWEKVPPNERRKFPHIAPDFIVEVKSPSDSLPKTKAKMDMWIENGVRLGFLINPETKTTWDIPPRPGSH